MLVLQYTLRPVADVLDFPAPVALETAGPAESLIDKTGIRVGWRIPTDLAPGIPGVVVVVLLFFEKRAEPRTQRLLRRRRVSKRSDLPLVVVEPQPVGFPELICAPISLGRDLPAQP